MEWNNQTTTQMNASVIWKQLNTTFTSKHECKLSKKKPIACRFIFRSVFFIKRWKVVFPPIKVSVELVLGLFLALVCFWKLKTLRNSHKSLDFVDFPEILEISCFFFKTGISKLTESQCLQLILEVFGPETTVFMPKTSLRISKKNTKNRWNYSPKKNRSK